MGKSHKLLLGVLVAGLILGNFIYLKKDSKPQIGVVIVPHHNLVSQKRAKILNEVSGRVRPETVIIVSTNHFQSGKGDIITTDRTWKLGDGNVESDSRRVNKLVESKLATKENEAFDGEHGVINLLEEVHSIFGAKILPIVIRSGTQKNSLDILAHGLEDICGKKCLMIASVDFSHYQFADIANMHDKLSIAALNNMDSNLIWEAETDSDEVLYLVMKIAGDGGYEKFTMKKNTNSGYLAKLPEAETTSYVMGWYELGKKMPQIDVDTWVLGPSVKLSQGNYSEELSLFGDRVFWGSKNIAIDIEGDDVIKNRWLKYWHLLGKDIATKSLGKGINIGENSTSNARVTIRRGDKIRVVRTKDRVTINGLGILIDETRCGKKQEGLMVYGDIVGSKIVMKFLPTKTVDCKPIILRGQERKLKLEEYFGQKFDTISGFDTIEI